MNVWEFFAQCPRLSFGLSVWWGIVAIVVTQTIRKGAA